jgi:hypothetical protein
MNFLCTEICCRERDGAMLRLTEVQMIHRPFFRKEFSTLKQTDVNCGTRKVSLCHWSCNKWLFYVGHSEVWEIDIMSLNIQVNVIGLWPRKGTTKVEAHVRRTPLRPHTHISDRLLSVWFLEYRLPDRKSTSDIMWWNLRFSRTHGCLLGCRVVSMILTGVSGLFIASIVSVNV